MELVQKIGHRHWPIYCAETHNEAWVTERWQDLRPCHGTVDTSTFVRVVIGARMVEQGAGEPLRILFKHVNDIVSWKARRKWKLRVGRLPWASVAPLRRAATHALSSKIRVTSADQCKNWESGKGFLWGLTRSYVLSLWDGYYVSRQILCQGLAGWGGGEMVAYDTCRGWYKGVQPKKSLQRYLELVHISTSAIWVFKHAELKSLTLAHFPHLWKTFWFLVYPCWNTVPAWSGFSFIFKQGSFLFRNCSGCFFTVSTLGHGGGNGLLSHCGPIYAFLCLRLPHS